jgi:protein O-GlcNAc transferase
MQGKLYSTAEMVFDPHSVANDLASGQTATALLRLRRRLCEAPTDTDALFLYAIAAHAMGEMALDRNRRVLAVVPMHVGAAANAAGALAERGALSPALRLLRRAVAVEPAFPEAYGNLGLCLLNLGDFAGAVVALKRVLRLGQPEPLTFVNLGTAFERLRRKDAAQRAYRTSAVLAPDFSLSVYNLALLAQAQGDAERAIDLFRRALALNPDDAFVHSNLVFCLAYRADYGSRRRATEAVRWAERHARVPPVQAGSWTNTPEPGRRLRIGYLSADLRTHAVAHNISGLIRHHDRLAVEVTLYSATPSHDGTTEAFRAAADGWREVSRLDDESIARQIHADRIDILCNIAAHTGHNRPRVPAFRPAPVQVSMFDLGTTGVPQVDYCVTDPVLNPPDTPEPFVETLVRLPWLVPHDPPAEAPMVTPLPAASSGRVTFVSANNPAKISPETIVLWSRILAGVPASRLMLKYADAFSDAATRARFEELFARHGIGTERLIFLPGGGDVATHLAQVGSADIALDTFPFNGSTTTFQSLWMGVPVVALAGSCFMGRFGASFLTTAGLPELVAADGDAYVAIAVGLAADDSRLSALRAGLRARVAGSPLCQPEPYARAVEAAFRDMWQRWCESAR